MAFVNRKKTFPCSSLKSDRDPVDEIGAVYFIMPTKDNIARIGKVEIDLCEKHFDDACLNILGSIRRFI